MPFQTRRTVSYLALVIVTTLILTGIYNAGMAIWEHRPQPFYRSLQVVVQSFTTTGYGEDAPWRTPQMNFLAIGMQFAGIALILTAVDVFAVPWLRGALTPTAPKAVTGLRDHVIVCEHTPRTEAFIMELDARGRDYVLIESNSEIAHELHEAGYRVVYGDPQSTTSLRNTQIESATAVVADAADDANASIVLAVRDITPDVRIITLVEDAELTHYHQVAGADEVLSPRQLLGKSLALELPTAVTTDDKEGAVIGDDFELLELSVAENSELCNKTFAEAGLREQFGVNAVGAWFDGEFVTPVDPHAELNAGIRLLVAGEPDQIDALREATASSVREFTPQKIILAGYGDAGQAAYETLAPLNSWLTVLDIDAKENVDIAGDARDPDVLIEAEIKEASSLILTVADDTTAIFSTLIARDLNPELYIVVRANEDENVQKLYRAGADYVQSLTTVSGRMLASTVFEDEEVLAYDQRVSIVRLPATGLAGTTLADAEVRTETGCTVVAVIRNRTTITEFDPSSFTFAADDEVIIAGIDDSITAFERKFGE
ncbi:potassium channel family protein [Halomicrococcus sp. NG-SE-24]|uniref:potassium channel family protein n=1 Tax=Halomicrococcus sp. NG-SE-24 TaxID=3436928 RepID=UPI003D97FE3B